MSTAYKIEGGEITEYEMPEGGLLIQATRDWVQTIRGGTEHNHTRAMLPVIQEITERVTPGTTWWVAPSLEHDKEDDSEWMGIAYRVPGVMFVSSNQSPRLPVHTAHHEAFHAVQDRLTDKEILAVRKALAERGPQWPDEYLMLQREFEANTYAAFAQSHYSGDRVECSRRFPENQVFADILTGVVGRRINKRGDGFGRRIVRSASALRRSA